MNVRVSGALFLLTIAGYILYNKFIACSVGSIAEV